MSYFSRVTKLASLLFSLVFLSACGGGSSDASQSPTIDTLVGTQQITFSGNGINDAQSNAFVLLLNDGTDPGNSIDITDNGDSGVSASGTIDFNSDSINFTATGSPTVIVSGLSCSLSVTYRGSVIEDDNNEILTTTGSISGTGTCGSTPINISGSFSGSS